MMKKTLQVPVIVGEGEAQFFVEEDVTVAPPSPPVYEIQNIKRHVEIVTAKVVKNKVLFNAILWKAVYYTTVEHVHDGTINGPVYHSSFKVPFGGFVDLCPYPGEEVCEGATPELLKGEVLGSKEVLHDEKCVDGIKVYNKLLEKTIVSLRFKATTLQHIEVETKEPCPPPKPEPKPCPCKSKDC